MPEVEQADPYLPFDVPRVTAIGENVLDVVPRCRLNLKHAPGAGARGQARLVAGLHPGEGTREPAVEAVVARPAVDLSAHFCLKTQAEEPAARPAQDGDRLRTDDAVRLQTRAFLRPQNGCLGDRSEDAVDRNEDAAPAEQKLQLGDVPAAAAASEQSVTEFMPGPPSELPPSSTAGDPVRRKVVAALKASGRAQRLRACDSVEGPSVIAALEERDLQRGHPGRSTPGRR